MSQHRADTQDIRPLRILILNLMPTKIETETQLLRLIGNSPLQVEVVLLQTNSYKPKNTSPEHLLAHYKTFDQVRNEKFDGLVITGAPVEHLPFEAVDYWRELQQILAWKETHVYSTFHICWGAQAALYHKYGVPKYPLPEKVFGVFPHRVLDRRARLMRGFDDEFMAPHSRHTEVRRADVERMTGLHVLSESEEAGVYIMASCDGREIYITGHSEYDPFTLHREYERDLDKGLPIAVPKNYYPGDNPQLTPRVRWRGHANLLFANWLNYYVYQTTPFDIDRIPDGGTI